MQENSLKIFNLNIETDKHFDRIVSFVAKHQPEVIFFQEVLEKDRPFLELALSMQSQFSVMRYTTREKVDHKLGLLTLSRLPFVKHYSWYYRGNALYPLRLQAGEGSEKIARVILVTEFSKGKNLFRLVNTHFTWSPNGRPNEYQQQDIKVLMTLLDEIQSFVVCGDFNVPRGGTLFNSIAKKYRDNIPLNVTTTIDKNLHKAGDLNIVVDGIFSTADYEVSEVKVVDNLSDHCGILATINKSFTGV